MLSVLLILSVARGGGFAATPPAAVKNLTAWYDARDNSTITATAKNVSQWTDKGPHGETLAQSTVALQPTYSSAGMNGLGAMTFSGSQVMISNDATFSKYLYPTSTVFIVQNSANDTQASSSVWSGSSGTQRYNLSLPSNGSCLIFGAGGNGPCLYFDFGDYANNPGGGRLDEAAGTTLGTTPPYYTTVGIHLWVGSGQSGTSQILRYDGTTIGSQTPDSAANFSCALAIGARGGCVSSSSYFTGSIGEIVVYIALLSNANYQIFEGILACKWGIQSNLPSGHLYSTACPSGSEATNLNAISGLSAWYDASDASKVTYAVSNVSQMNDKSGNGLTLTQATSGSQPTLATVNGAQAVVFNGSEDLTSSLSNNLAIGSNPSSMFVVAAYTGTITSSWGNTFSYGTTNTGLSRTLGKAEHTGAVPASEHGADVTSSSSWSSSTALAFADFGTSTESVVVNGGPTTSGTHMPNIPASTPLRLGSDSSQYWIGPIYEAILYNSSLSTVEEQFIEGYLACKWGLQSSLPSTHPYKISCPPSTATATATASLSLVLALSPSGVQPPATDLTYTTTFTNSSGTLDYNPTITSPVPANTWFKCASATYSLGSTFDVECAPLRNVVSKLSQGSCLNFSGRAYADLQLFAFGTHALGVRLVI